MATAPGFWRWWWAGVAILVVSDVVFLEDHTRYRLNNGGRLFGTGEFDCVAHGEVHGVVCHPGHVEQVSAHPDAAARKRTLFRP